MDATYCPTGEKRISLATGHRNTVVYVLLDLIAIKRNWLGLDRDSLAELVHSIFTQDLPKLGLSHEDDLKLLLLIVFQVR